MNRLYKELLQVALGVRPELSFVPTDAEWDSCFKFADEQAIVGVLWGGIQCLPKNQMPYLDLMMDWLGLVEYLQSQAEDLDKKCLMVTRGFKRAGFDSVILKGQGLAKLYKGIKNSLNHHASTINLLRTPGDIDCWVFADRQLICKFLSENVPDYNNEHEGDLHTEFKVKGTIVEVHFSATYLTTPKYARRLKEWIDKQTIKIKDKKIGLEGNIFPTPTIEFNLVYLILHMYRHYLFEGIGLRHVVDYYILLRRTLEESESSTEYQKTIHEAYHTLKMLGADKFAGALMYVLADGLGLGTDILLCHPEPWRGKMLMSAIMKGGNFGKADIKNSVEYREWGVKRLWRFVVRNLSLFMAYPSEIGWHIVKRLI